MHGTQICKRCGHQVRVLAGSVPKCVGCGWPHLMPLEEYLKTKELPHKDQKDPRNTPDVAHKAAVDLAAKAERAQKPKTKAVVVPDTTKKEEPAK